MTRETKYLVGVALCILGSCFGCATAGPALTVETPRELAPSAGSVYSAPVHEGTNLDPSGFVAADSDTDAAPVVASDGGGEDAPEVAPKAGLKMGEVR
jgi:hypothetical protein